MFYRTFTVILCVTGNHCRKNKKYVCSAINIIGMQKLLLHSVVIVTVTCEIITLILYWLLSKWCNIAIIRNLKL